VNPVAGREVEYDMQPSKKKKIIIIGGGPAGMETAAISASKGHKVVLLEKGDRLGGQLLLSGATPYKDTHAHLTKYLIRQVERSGVEVRLGCDVDINYIQKENPDVVIVAAGAVPVIPAIPGIKQKNVVTALDVISGRSEVGEKVIVVGGGMVGLETAEFLSTMGKEVTLFEMLEEVGQDTIPVLKEAIKERLNQADVKIKTNIEVVEITSKGVKLKDGDKITSFEGSSVVLACGMRSSNDLKGQLEKVIKEIYTIGDCVKPRRIRQAIEEGLQAGYET